MSVDWHLIFEGVAALGTVVTAAGLILAGRQFKKQMNAETFLACTERFETIMCTLPEGLRLARAEGDPEEWASQAHVQEAFRRYYNLFSQEFYLHQTGYLSDDLWCVWEEGIKATVCSPLGRAIWQSIEDEFESYGDFRKWVGEVQAQRAHSPKETAFSVSG